MPSYVLYGLEVASSVRLPVPTRVDPTDPDVRVRETAIDTGWADFEAHLGHVQVTDWAITFVYEDVGAIQIREGSEIRLDPDPDASEALLSFFVLGKGLAVVLYQRGRLVLHASAAAVDGRGVAFLGGPGQGKSTMAGLAHARGHRVLSDDVVPVLQGDRGPTTTPAYPGIKLDDRSAAAVSSLADGTADDFRDPVAHPEPMEKGLYALTGGAGVCRPTANGDPCSIDRIYVLETGGGPELERLSGQAAYLALVRHTYAAYLLGTDALDAHFRQCASLAQNVPVARLRRPNDLERLPEVARLVEADGEH